jgi:hypothetical protein
MTLPAARLHIVEWQNKCWLVILKDVEGNCSELRYHSNNCLTELEKPHLGYLASWHNGGAFLALTWKGLSKTTKCVQSGSPASWPNEGTNLSFAEDKHKNLIHDSQCLSRDSNRALSEYESRTLPLHRPNRWEFLVEVSNYCLLKYGCAIFGVV